MSRNFSYIRKTDKGIEAYNGSKWVSLKVNDVVETTYKQLKKWKDKGKLDPYTWYLIKDFQTIHLFNGPSVGDDINYGPIEPLLVQASSKDNIFHKAYSLDFPQDIIYYDIDSGAHIPSEGNKGWIYLRHDLNLNIKFLEDFRGVKTRLWAIGSDNPLNIVGGTYCLVNTSIDIGWDENVNATGNGSLNISAPNTSDYIDVYSINNRREFSSFVYADIEVSDFSLYYSVSNFVYRNVDASGSGVSNEELFEIEVGKPGNGPGNFRTANTVILGDTVRSWKVGLCINNIFAGTDISFINADEIENTFYSITGGDGRTAHYDKSFRYCLFGSFLRYDGVPSFRGPIDRCSFKHTDNSGNIINDTSSSFSLPQCVFKSIRGLHFTKLGSGNNTTGAVEGLVIEGVPYYNKHNLSNYPSTFDYIIDSFRSNEYVSRLENKSNFSITKSVSSNQVSLNNSESRIAGKINVDTSGSAQTVDSISGSPEHTLTIQASGANDLTLSHSTADSDSLRLPTGSQSGGIVLSDNGLDFAEVKLVDGKPTVVNFQTY